MIFTRTDGLDANGYNQVIYASGELQIIATTTGVYLTGTSAKYTDANGINYALRRAYAQYNSLSTQGVAVSEKALFGWRIWNIGP